MTSIQYNALLKFANQEPEESLSFFDKLKSEVNEVIKRPSIIAPTLTTPGGVWNYLLRPNRRRTPSKNAVRGGAYRNTAWDNGPGSKTYGQEKGRIIG